MRRTTLLLVVAATALLLSSTAAFAAIKIGTHGPDVLVGTKNADHITGEGGDDALEGKAGDDVYHFADGFGSDTLTEPKKVGKLPGGTDAISFSGVTTASAIALVPQWDFLGFNQAHISNTTNNIDLGTSVVERAVGGSGDDFISAGVGRHTLKGGAGGEDSLTDYGGWNGDSAFPGLPASDDTYKGFASGAGFDSVRDYGGTGDVLDLRPWESSDVYLRAFTAGGPSPNSLVVSAGDRGVYVYGHFAPTIEQDENGTMEKIVFADETITSASEVKALIKSSSQDGRAFAAPEAPAPQPPEKLLE